MRRIVWGSLLVLGVSAFGLFLWAYLGGPQALSSVLGWMVFLSPIVALIASIMSVVRLSVGSALKLDRDTLVVHTAREGARERRIAREDVVEGWQSPEEREIHLRLRNGNIVSAPIEDEREGYALLESLGVDASKRTMRMRLGPVDFLNAITWLLGPFIAMWVGDTIGSALHQNGALAVPIAIVVFILESYLIRRLFGPSHLVIGADGIIVERGFGSTFVPFEEISSIATAPNRVTLKLVNGKEVRARARHLGAAESAMIEARVRDALSVRAQRSATPTALAALDRGERNGEAWRQAMAALLDRNRGYRAAMLTREQVLAVLADPGARADRRIGAAMALMQSGDEEGKARIRIAAESVANRMTRIALETIADGELESAAIEEAMEEELSRAKRVEDA